MMPKIIRVDEMPRKSNSSYGNYTVDYDVETPFGGILRTTAFFMKKKQAIDWIISLKNEVN